ncbi:hypothetical protein QR680_011854 [Steinernema hermaphroditum]|uniref:Uncharacterized protein n=1 Tax=Steinernema hermaphroditum TaxID=289476 RepID=A0AA39I2L6_9BILA|nr:hypothetical protein QR680_011854 [Steinernema hermaphroditum]
MKYVYVVLALFLSVGYGCHPMVKNPSANPGPEDVQKTDAPTEATTMSTPGGDEATKTTMTTPTTETTTAQKTDAPTKTTITPATETPSTPSDKGPEDEEEKLKKLMEKLMAAEQSIKFVRDDFLLAMEVLAEREQEYEAAKKGEDVKAIEQQIKDKTAADKAAQDLTAAQNKLTTAMDLEQKAEEALKQAEKQRDEENDPAMKPAREQAVTDAEKKLEEVKGAVKTAQEEREAAQMEQTMKARNDLSSLEELQKKKEEAEKKNKEAIENLDKAKAESKRLNIKGMGLDAEIKQLKNEIEELKAKKKE